MNTTLIPWYNDSEKPAISVLFGRNFAIDARGRCHDSNNFQPVDEYLYYDEEVLGGRTGYIRPSILKRDMDLYAQRLRTDLVIQGVARSPSPTTSLTVTATIRGPGTQFSQVISVHGDRRVTRGAVGLRLSSPVPFTEMPLRYDKAYGGTDEHSRKRLADRLEDRMIFDTVGEAEDREYSEFSYPRNPAGKGYVLSPESAHGTLWPNLEFPDQLLTLESLALPQNAWGKRPYPAGFDWFAHAWFPRVAFFGEIPPTANGRPPQAEVDLGLLAADLTSTPVLQRPKTHFSQGAHPYMWRHRMHGNETVSISTIGSNGSPLHLVMPGLKPSVRVRLQGTREQHIPADLDLVFIEADTRRLTLLWRASVALDTVLSPTWRDEVAHSIHWN